MSECTHDCATCGADCASRKPESLLEPQNPMSDIKKVIAVMSGKGGVGKSLVTGLLATLTQRNGKKAAILDADITGPSIPKMFGIHDKAMGCEDGILPAQSRTGVKMMSLNLLLEKDTESYLFYRYGSYYYFKEPGIGGPGIENIEDLKVTTDGPYYYCTYSIVYSINGVEQSRNKYSAVVARKYENGTYYWSIFSGKKLN